MAKVAPVSPGGDEAEEAKYKPEAPPPGFVEDPNAKPPELNEAQNEEFLAASRKRRQAALATRGQRRYNLALRVVGFFVILNCVMCMVPLLDNIYTLSWATVSGAFVKYSLNHWTIVDPSLPSFAPYEHYRTMYDKYDTSYIDAEGFPEVSFVLLQPDNVPSDREGYCALVQTTWKYAAANGETIPPEAWCEGGVVLSFCFLVLSFVFSVGAVAVWYLLLTGDGDVPPSRTVQYAPPDADNPQGKAFIVTTYHAAAVHVLSACCGCVGMDAWDKQVLSMYPVTNCGKNVCPAMGKLYQVCLATVVLQFVLTLCYRAVARQNHLFMLRKHIAAAKAGDTFGTLKISGNAWFLRYIDETDPDGSGKNALHWASRKGAATAAQILVQSGADPRVRDSSGWTSMHYAARYGHEQVLKNLLGSKFGEELVHQREALGAAPLHMCAVGGHLDSAMILVNSSGRPDLNAGNVFGQTPLMLAAGRGGKGSSIVDMLITAGADPKRRDASGSTAFHYAANAGSTYALERLLRATYRASLAPLGGRRRPAVTIQAVHNAWGETAADEAHRTDRKACRELLLANAACFSIEDKERLKVFAVDAERPPPLYARKGRDRGRGVGGAPGGGGEKGLGSGGARGLNAFGGGDEEEGAGDDDDEEEAELMWKGYVEDETGYPSDDERISTDAEALAAVLRKRHNR